MPLGLPKQRFGNPFSSSGEASEIDHGESKFGSGTEANHLGVSALK